MKPRVGAGSREPAIKAVHGLSLKIGLKSFTEESRESDIKKIKTQSYPKEKYDEAKRVRNAD